jgi:hypothetical protein
VALLIFSEVDADHCFCARFDEYVTFLLGSVFVSRAMSPGLASGSFQDTPMPETSLLIPSIHSTSGRDNRLEGIVPRTFDVLQ